MAQNSRMSSAFDKRYALSNPGKPGKSGNRPWILQDSPITKSVYLSVMSSARVDSGLLAK
jgi:hypothetical protein